MSIMPHLMRKALSGGRRSSGRRQSGRGDSKGDSARAARRSRCRVCRKEEERKAGAGERAGGSSRSRRAAEAGCWSRGQDAASSSSKLCFVSTVLSPCRPCSSVPCVGGAPCSPVHAVQCMQYRHVFVPFADPTMSQQCLPVAGRERRVSGVRRGSVRVFACGRASEGCELVGQR